MSLHYCVTKQWSYRKKRSAQLLIGWLTRLLPGCWEVIGRDQGGHLQVLGRGEGVFRFSSHVRDQKVCVCACVCVCVCVRALLGGGGTGANFLSREWGKGNRGRRQEVGRGSCTHCPCTTLFLWQPPAGWEVSRETEGRVWLKVPLKGLFRKNVMCCMYRKLSLDVIKLSLGLHIIYLAGQR